MDDSSRSLDARTSTERRLDRIEVRVDQLAVEVRAIEVSTVTRLNSIDAKLAFVSSVLDGVNGLTEAIRGPKNDPDQGLVSQVASLKQWRDELRGSLRLILVVAAAAPLVGIAIGAWRFLATGTP